MYKDCGGQTFDVYGVEVDWDATEAAALKANAVACGCGGAAAAMPVLALVTAALSETNAKLAQSWANFSLLSLYSHRNAWANLNRLGQPNSFLAPAFFG